MLKDYHWPISKATLFVLLFLFVASSASAKIKINLKSASAKELKEFKAVLRCLATGPIENDSTSIKVDTAGIVSICKPPVQDTFESVEFFKQIVKDTTCIEIFLEEFTPAGNMVLFGAWRREGTRASINKKGNGQVSIDMLDIAMLPSKINYGVFTKEGVVFHELLEVFDGSMSKLKFGDAHMAGIAAESVILNELDPTKEYTRRLSDESLKDSCFFFVWEDLRNEGATSTLKVTLDPKSKRIIKTTVTRKKKKLKSNLLADSAILRKNVYITNALNMLGLKEITRAGDSTKTISNFPNTSLKNLQYLEIRNGNEIFTGNAADGTVWRINILGDSLTSYSHPDLGSPSGIVYASTDSSIWVADNSSGEIFKFHLSGSFLDKLTHIDISLPAELELDSQDNLIVSNHGLANILVFNTTTLSLVMTIAHDSLMAPAGLKYDHFNDHLYVIDNSSEKLLRFDYTSGNLSKLINTKVSSPWGMDFVGAESSDHFGIQSDFVSEIVVVGGNGEMIFLDTTGVVMDSFQSNDLSPLDVEAIPIIEIIGEECNMSFLIDKYNPSAMNYSAAELVLIEGSVDVLAGSSLTIEADRVEILDDSFSIANSADFVVFVKDTECPNLP